MQSNNYNSDWLHNFIYDEDISEESVYAIYEFLINLVEAFESKGFCKIRNHKQKKEEEYFKNSPCMASTELLPTNVEDI